MKKSDTIMTPSQFRSGLSYLNMSYSGFARRTGKTTQTIYGYASGRAHIPLLVAQTLHHLVKEGHVEPEFQRKRRTKAQMQAAMEEILKRGTL